ncbi:glycosyltransferase family 2 protein [Flavobacterium sp. W22_SRS_FP1]|uniref:glycosyltransferase family 2 protein n=1 Tax=Flavobacterium sp. W22_SRS_FP1 TaxID=3240276 RepID=UPI003F91BCB7
MSNKKCISIITVVFNGVENIEDTIVSVINQTYDNIEYIIIDGGSTDGTQDIIKKYGENLYYWVSEPDKGIYDAMNKGIKASTAVWVLFLNAGDVFFNQDLLSSLQSYLHNCDVLYGKTAIKKKNGDTSIRDYYPLSVDWKVIPYCHQSVLIKRKLLKQALFDTNYKIAADYNQYFTLKTKDVKFKSINKTFSIYDNDGFSSLNQKALLSEYKKISLLNHFGVLEKIKIRLYFWSKNIFNKS